MLSSHPIFSECTAFRTQGVTGREVPAKSMEAGLGVEHRIEGRRGVRGFDFTSSEGDARGLQSYWESHNKLEKGRARDHPCKWRVEP